MNATLQPLTSKEIDDLIRQANAEWDRDNQAPETAFQPIPGAAVRLVRLVEARYAPIAAPQPATPAPAEQPALRCVECDGPVQWRCPACKIRSFGPTEAQWEQSEREAFERWIADWGATNEHHRFVAWDAWQAAAAWAAARAFVEQAK